MREVFRLHLLFVLALLVHSAASAKKIHRYGRAQSYDRPPDFYPQQQQDIIVTVYPHEKEVREGTEAIFDCRARSEDGSVYPEVRWSRAGGQLPSHAHESGGRLTISSVQTSDSGSYLCSASHMGQLKQAQAHLRVQSYGAQDVQGVLQTSSLCRADERACGNNECVKADYVCDGEPDCRDRSDELNCPSLRACEPNEFKCNNGRCVQKMWLCDGDDDCGDNSDEQQCQHKKASDGCGPTEFRCRDGQQCVLSSFQCDGTNDCRDGSDEVGCVQPTVVQAPETNKQVQAGGTFQLTCRAVAVPEPYINWRLNWGPVCDPPRCLQHSEGGLGTLTINDAQPLDQGAYTCEAINVKGRVLATPDCIVRIVSIPSPTYEPRPQPQVHCDPAGSMSQQVGYGGQCQCKPLATGPSCGQCVPGSYHLNNKAPQGCLKCFCFGVTDQCRSSSWYRSKEKLQFTGDSQGVTISDSYERDVDENAPYEFVHPGMITYSNGGYGAVKYWRMPQRFLGNRISSYGGELAFDVQHSCSGQLSQEPLVIIKGNKITLIHRPRDSSQLAAPDRSNRVTVDTYETNFEHENGRPASREDLVMVLADLSSLMIRATHCDDQRSTSLGDVSWEIAVDRDTQDRLALEVEQCSCPPGYTGLSCEECAPGYERSGHGPYLGTCVPARGAPQCSAAGAVSVQPSYGGVCQCKAYAIGAQCDQCPPNSFHMSAENPQGCIPCFCSGVTQQCSQSGYSRATIEINYMQGSADQLEVTTSDIHAPFQPQSRPQLTGREISYSSFYETPGQTLYWKMPAPFLGNKVTSYGGTLKYVFRYSGAGSLNGDPDVIIRGNDIMLSYKNPQPTHADRENVVEVKLFENHWTRIDGQPATREHLLMALSDLDHILIKMNYLDDCSMSSLISVSLEHAEPQQTGNRMAYEVEQCVCPPGYMGTSCEDCAPGYSRVSGGLYLGLCERCECHGHATQCDKEHGFCIDCQHNTEGDQCERCKPGFSGDARRGTPHDCQPAATRPPCNCNNHSPRGCDSFGRCLMCEHSTEGIHCEQCKKGYYGDATRGTPYDCTPCPCPAASDCFLDPYGQVQCRNCPAGFSGRLCDECAPGYTRSRTHGGRECEPIGHVGPSDVVFVPTPEATLRVQIDQPKNLHVQPGGTAQWYCRIVGPRGPNLRLEWTKVGTNALPSSAIQTNGQLIINNAHEEDAGQYRCTAQGPHQFATDDATLVVAQRQPNEPVISPEAQTVDEGAQATFLCTIADAAVDSELKWRREDGADLGYDVEQDEGVLRFTNVQPSDAGAYICYTEDEDGETIESSPAYLNIRPTALDAPVLDSESETVKEGGMVTFRCSSPQKDVILRWQREDGRPLSENARDIQGILTISDVRQSDSGVYVCTAQDPSGELSPVDSSPAYLDVQLSTPVTPLVVASGEVVDEGERVTFQCYVPGKLNIQVNWHRQDGVPLSADTIVEGATLIIPRATLADTAAYICSVEDGYDGLTVDSAPAYLSVNPVEPISEPQKPTVETTSISIQEGTSVTIACSIQGASGEELHWRRADDQYMSFDASDENGILTISNVKVFDAAEYICYTYDRMTGERIDSEPVNLVVTPSDEERTEEDLFGEDREQPQPEPDQEPEPEPERELPLEPAVEPKPTIEKSTVTVDQGETITLKCSIPVRDSETILHWRRADGQSMGWHITETDGTLTIENIQPSDAGAYICSAEDTETYEIVDSEPAHITVLPLTQQPTTTEVVPVLDSSSKTVEEGDTVELHCTHTEQSLEVQWRREDDVELDFTRMTIENGILIIQNVHQSDAGKFVCFLEDWESGARTDYEPVNLLVNPSETTESSTTTVSSSTLDVKSTESF